MSLFKYGNFTTHSGLNLDWKIDCDALTDDDIYCIAIASYALLETINYPRTEFIGIPSGGVRLANKMQELFGKPVSNEPPLIVDDVLTTGNSMKEVMSQHKDSKGLVIFARAPTPINVVSMFSCNWFATRSDMKTVLDSW